MKLTVCTLSRCCGLAHFTAVSVFLFMATDEVIVINLLSAKGLFFPTALSQIFSHWSTFKWSMTSRSWYASLLLSQSLCHFRAHCFIREAGLLGSQFGWCTSGVVCLCSFASSHRAQAVGLRFAFSFSLHMKSAPLVSVGLKSCFVNSRSASLCQLQTNKSS